MNCPHHHKIYASRLRSYRELRLRFAEYGEVYRWEASGAVSGLLRARMLSMNDAHIYCTEAQTRDVFREVLSQYDEAYRILGLSNYYIRLSRWDPDDPKAGRCTSMHPKTGHARSKSSPTFWWRWTCTTTTRRGRPPSTG